MSSKMDRPTRRLRIAYLCVNDPLDKRSWSGITYYLGQSLQRNVGDVDFLGPIEPSPTVAKMLRAVAKFIRIFFKKEYDVKHSLLAAAYYAGVLKKKMKGRSYDCIVAPAASTELAFFKTTLPLIYVTDATFKLISEFYKWEFENIPALSKWEGNHVEQKALHNCSRVILSSNWAAQSAINDYKVPAQKIHIMPLGANIDFVPAASTIFDKLQNQTITLLYLAVEWERKGGSIAFDTLKALHEAGIKAKLIVCGCIPPPQFQHPSMEVIPFLNKNKKEDHNRFVQILSSVHFLLLPTRADCSLLVACEANSYGVPAISTNVGGVSDVVVDGVNGYCLPLAAGSNEYATLIKEIFYDLPRYHQLVQTSRKRFEERLNWDKWAENFVSLFDEIVRENKQTPH